MEHLGDEERLGGHGDREHRQRGDRAAQRDREVALAEQVRGAVASADRRGVVVRDGLPPRP